MKGNFVQDLERIFEAAMESGNYSAALNAKKLQLQQYQMMSESAVRVEDLDDETLKRLVGWNEDGVCD
jgi:hypothetical protein